LSVALEQQAERLMSTICEQVLSKGNHDVPRDAIAPSIGLETPVSGLGADFRKLRETAQVLKDAGYITAPVGVEFVRLTELGLNVCAEGRF
jgi:hypothetical protein